MKTKLILFFIIILAFVLRIYNVGQLPAILNRDEAALAYNAFLLKEVGKDEWGRTWPLTLESFGDYKLPGYPTMLVILFNFFPISDFTVRLPSVLSGTFLVLTAFYFAKHFKLKDKYALLFSFLIATTPIFFFYSRSAWEANVALCLLVTTVLLILKNKSFATDFLAILLYLVAVLVYNTPLLLLPFIILTIPLLRGFKQYQKWFLLCLGLSFVLIFSLFNLLSITSQKSAITIFSDETTWMRYTQYRENFTGLNQTLLGNKYVYWLKIIITNFINSFSPRFLVTLGGKHPWHTAFGFSHFSWTVYLLGIAGIIHAFIKRKKTRRILTYLLFVGLFPAVITVDAPHATRSLFFFFIFTFLSVMFISNNEEIINKFFKAQLKIKNKLVKNNLFVFTILLFLLFESFAYFKSYFIDYPQNQLMFAPGFDGAVQKLEKNYPDQKIAIVDGGGYQYILLAWYLKIPPQDYLNNNVRQLKDKIGMKYGERVLNYHFIAEEADRSDNEKFLLTWENNQWKIKEY